MSIPEKPRQNLVSGLSMVLDGTPSILVPWLVPSTLSDSGWLPFEDAMANSACNVVYLNEDARTWPNSSVNGGNIKRITHPSLENLK